LWGENDSVKETPQHKKHQRGSRVVGGSADPRPKKDVRKGSRLRDRNTKGKGGAPGKNWKGE